ncbi:MAG: hypothetical protein WD049_08715 [Candidatus Paceibacterota bacterium]
MRSKDKAKAIELRREGWSYTQIMSSLGLTSKGTLSHWFKDLELSSESKRKLSKNLQDAHRRGLFKANQRKKEKVVRENGEAYRKGKALAKRAKVGEKNRLLLIATALYWGEGTKFYNHRTASLSFSNADPKMIRVYLRFLREVLGVLEDRIKVGVYVHQNVDVEKAKKYWQSITKISPDSFFVVRAFSRASKQVRDKNKLCHGTLAIRVNDRKLFHQMRGMTDVVAEIYG